MTSLPLTFLNWKQQHPDQCFVIEKVNNIGLCNECSLDYGYYYVSIETTVKADWSSLDTYSAVSLIPDDALVTNVFMDMGDLFE